MMKAGPLSSQPLGRQEYLYNVDCVTAFRFRFLSFALIISLVLLACFPLSSGNMRPGEMTDRRPGQWPGPGGFDQSGSPPEVTPAPTTTPGGAASVSYRQQIQPILDRKCVGCHGGQAGLFMDSYDNLMAGGPGGRVVIPGDPDRSMLVRSIKGQSQSRMPPSGTGLAPSEIDIFVTWIAEGCPNN
jgi:mono/diheme cytochrome c family protein